MWHLASSIAGLLPCLPLAGAAQESDYSRDVRPILAEHCFACHGPDAAVRKAGLRLDTAQGLHLAVVPGLPSESLLLSRIDHDDPSEVMPPPEAKRPLSAGQRAVLREWISQGAVTEQHWAFVSPTRPDPRLVSPTEDLHPIDGFVQARLEGSGLTPSTEAPAAVLLRRLHLDLIGLPPSPVEVTRFEEAHALDADAAVAAVVERLLADPAFGEAWARPWLDLARYADSNGYQADQLRPSWAYRDWVIQSINANQPFDEFTIEQLAGDLLPDATLAQRIATGFHRAAPCNVEAGVHPEENRTLQVIDRVNTTATVWLGLTLECAQCHDHKYDPFSTEEYYQLFAYFNQTALEVEQPSGVTDVSHDFVGPFLELPLSPEADAEQQRLNAELAALAHEREEALRAALPAWVTEARSSLADASTWRVLQPASLTSTGQEEIRPLEDGSVLLVGPVPDRVTYTLDLPVGDEAITILRLEALTHPEISGGGPGRGDPERSNFVLNEIELWLDGEPVDLQDARADFEQDGWPAAGAVDGDPQSGWAIAPQFGQEHALTFVPSIALEGERLTVELHQNWGRGRVLGRVRLSAAGGDPTRRALPEEIAGILRLDDGDWTDEQRGRLEAAFAAQDDELPELDARRAEVLATLQSIRPARTLVMQELSERRPTHVLERGQYLSPGDRVTAGTPAALHPIAVDAPPDRLALARWIVDPANPLTARVVVNRWWAELFGRGLVETLEDFGVQSTPPSHPELLDWLAVELLESGWDRKHVLQQIVTSRTYRQAARVDARSLALDPENRRLARGPRVRLAAEAIRDQALAAAGLLDDSQFGPPVMPYQPPGVWRAVGRNAPKWEVEAGSARYRRGVYVVWRRAAPFPSFVAFDAPDRAACTVARPRTNTPLQALALLNDPVYLEAALALGDRALREAPAAPLAKVFRLVLARQPDADELELLEQLYQARLTDYERHPERAQALVEGVRGAFRPASTYVARLAAIFHVAHVVLNLDEAVFKG